MKNLLRASLTRIADLDGCAVEPLPRSQWEWGDYTAVEIVPGGVGGPGIELTSGRITQVVAGDRLIGALGTRFATLELTGSWEQVGDDGILHVLTGAGLLGRMTSRSYFCPLPLAARYLGHLTREGGKATMQGSVRRVAACPLRKPVFLVVGSSMSAGKTLAARVLVRRLKERGLGVTAAKLTGAGRYRDILTMGDAGADHIYDFVDGGLPSTVCPPEHFRRGAEEVLSRMAADGSDVVVVEAGASPLEPYNGDVAVELLREQIRLLVLCASDPYAAVGIRQAFGLVPDVISGTACSTLAGRQLAERLTGLPAVNFADPAESGAVDALVEKALAF